MQFKFNSCLGQSGESMATYVLWLRKLAQHCEYDTILNVKLCNHLVRGIQVNQI